MKMYNYPKSSLPDLHQSIPELLRDNMDLDEFRRQNQGQIYQPSQPVYRPRQPLPPPPSYGGFIPGVTSIPKYLPPLLQLSRPSPQPSRSSDSYFILKTITHNINGVKHNFDIKVYLSPSSLLSLELDTYTLCNIRGFVENSSIYVLLDRHFGEQDQVVAIAAFRHGKYGSIPDELWDYQNPSYYLYNVCTLPEFRGLHLQEVLLKTAFGHLLRNAQYRPINIYSEVSKNNQGAIRLYNRLGFVTIGDSNVQKLQLPLQTPQQKSSFSWYLPADCQKKFGNLQIKGLLGSGKYGSIYEACEESVCQKIVKVVDIKTPHTYEDKFQNEAKLNKMASDLGVSPKFYTAFTCSNVPTKPGQTEDFGFIITEKWDMSLKQYFETYKKEIPGNLVTLIKQKLEKLIQNKIYHHDMHEGNIVLKLNKTTHAPIDIGFIDFGQALYDIKDPHYVDTLIFIDRVNLNQVINRMMEDYSV